MVHNFKVSPSAGCVFAAKAICNDNKKSNKDYITLTDIL